MHEDTKKSQTLISGLKKNYDDLQNRINQLNNKIGRISGNVDQLRVLFTIEDLERENEFQRDLEDKLDKADEDTNADKQDGNLDESKGSNHGGLDDSAFPGYPPRESDWSLQMRKKVIIKEINDIVNLFNDNSRAVRDSKNKSEAEITNLITNNKVIQKQAGEIDARLKRAFDFSDQIDALLDSISDELLKRLREKYQEKQELIDEIGQLHDQLNKKHDVVQQKTDDSLKNLDKIIAKLEAVSPLNNPSPKNSTPQQQQFIDNL